MKSKIRVDVPSPNGKIQQGIMFLPQNRTVRFKNTFDADNNIIQIEFDGHKQDLPDAVDLYKLINMRGMVDSNVDLVEKAPEDLQYSPNLIRNPRFQTGDLTEWINGDIGSISVVTEKHLVGDYSLRQAAHAGTGFLRQVLPPVASEGVMASLWWIATTGNATVKMELNYTDGTKTTITDTVIVPIWSVATLQAAQGKYLAFLDIYPNDNVGFFYYGYVSVVQNPLNYRIEKSMNSVSLAVSGNLVAAVASKVLKLHALWIQAGATVEGDIQDDNGGNNILHFKLQDREGAVFAHIKYPDAWGKSGVGKPLYVTFTTAGQCYFTPIYSDVDTS